MIDLFFVYTGTTWVEPEVIREIKPPKLLLSYYYFRNKNLEDVVEQLGYVPEIMLDSGAYSAWSKGKNIALVDYMNYIRRNKEWITHYIALDVIGDSRLSRWYYKIMREYGFNPIPVFHFGENEKYLNAYIEDGTSYIALGGTVPVKNKQEVANWVASITSKHPNVSFHLLGSSSDKILGCGVASCDSSTWVTMAINGYPKSVKGRTRESKKERAKLNMLELLDRFNQRRAI